MKKRALSFSLLVGLICGIGTSSAQDKDQTYIREIGRQAKAIDQGQKDFRMVEIDVSGVRPETDYQKLKSYTDDQGKVVKVINRVEEANGGVRIESYYFDAKGTFNLSLTASHSFADSGTHYYMDETHYFRSKRLIATNTRDGEFAKGEKFDSAKINGQLISASETDIPKRETYEYHRKRAETIERLVRAFSGKRAKTPIPVRSLLESISPNARYLVKWSSIDDDRADFFIIDLDTGKKIDSLLDGLPPMYSSVDYWAEWSEDSTHLAFGFDARWSSMGGELFTVSHDSVKSLGDLHASTGKLAAAHLKKRKHPYVQGDVDDVHGFMNVLSVENDGCVHLVLSTQSKSDDPDENFETEMTVALEKNGSARATGVRLLKRGQDPAEFAADDDSPEVPRAKPIDKPAAKDTGFVITERKIGPIALDTPFSLKAVRKLFPEHRVVASKESFEEGGEQPVIHVIGGREIILTLVPIPDTADLSYVYTTHGGVSTQLGFAVGDSFGDVFEATPEHAFYEGISGEVVSEAPGIDNVRFRFSPDQGNPDDDGLPAYRKLKTWTLQSIEWSPAKG